MRFEKNRQGNVGSRRVSLIVRYRSYKKKEIHETAENERRQMMVGEFQASVSGASSRAVTSNNDAARSRIVPTTSTFLSNADIDSHCSFDRELDFDWL